MGNKAETVITSSIKDITVYRGGAFITRSAKVKLQKGRNSVTIEKLSSTIKNESIQVGVAADVTCLQVSYEASRNIHRIDSNAGIDYKTIDERIAEIQNKLKVIEYRLNSINTINLRFDISNGIEKLQAYTDHNEQELEKLITNQSKLLKEKELLEKRRLEKNTLNMTGIWQKLPAVINIELDCLEEKETEIEIQYFESCATWEPHYDIRISDNKPTVSFVLKGKITQSTGEEWIDVDISVSTGSYSQNRYKGDLPIWRVKPSKGLFTNFLEVLNDVNYADEEYDDEYSSYEIKAKPQRGSVPKGAKPNSKRTATEIINTVDSPAVEPEIIDNQNSIIYKLSEKFSIQNGKGSDFVTIIKHEIECEIDSYTTPKLDCTAFMVTKVKDYAKYSFMKCEANIFNNNRFIGQTKINPVGENGEMLVSLGQDNKILVNRIVEKQMSSKSFIGGVHTREELYLIKVLNKKAISTHVYIVDQIPVSTNSKVSIETTELSGGILEDITGKVLWEIDVKPDEEKYLRLGFKIVSKR